MTEKTWVHSAYEFPTLEWVKEPVDVETGRPSGRTIRMRHLNTATTGSRTRKARSSVRRPELHPMTKWPISPHALTANAALNSGVTSRWVHGSSRPHVAFGG